LVATVLTTKRATLELPLCDACHARWRQARSRGVLLGIGTVVILVAASVATGINRSELAGLILLGAILVVIVALAFSVSRLIRPHVLSAKRIDDEHVTLLGVHPRAGERVARG
jgi:hypothetical protein